MHVAVVEWISLVRDLIRLDPIAIHQPHVKATVTWLIEDL